MKRPSIIDFVTDPQLLGLSISPAQAVILKTRTGEPLTAEERDLWTKMTGLAVEHYGPRREMTCVLGARSGKGSRICAPLILYESIFGDWRSHLTKGETGVAVVVAQGQREAATLYGYIRGQIEASPLLRSLLADEPLKTEFTLTNGARIVTTPSTARAARGASIFAGAMDESAHYRADAGPDADVEIRTSIRRGMLGFPNPLLLAASTPFAKSGLIWDDFRTLFGHYHPDAVVFHGPSALFNPTVTEERLEVERRLDPARFAREYLAEFAEDVDTFLPRAWVDGAISAGVRERPFVAGRRYFAAVDASGGGADAFTLAIVHAEGEGESRKIVQDVGKAWQSSRQTTVDLEAVVRDAARILKAYALREVASDAFAAGWARQAWQRAGVRVVSPVGDRSECYMAAEPWFAQGRVEILDDPDLARELRQLERRYLPGGRVKVDHPRGKHDDRADALAKAVAAAGAVKERRLCGAPLIVQTPKFVPWVETSEPYGMPW